MDHYSKLVRPARRPRKERYAYQHADREWLLSIVNMVDVVLEHSGSFDLQDVADHIDYGPHEVSPRTQATMQKVVAAYDRTIANGLENCKRGVHKFGKHDRCFFCKKPRFEIIE